MGVVVSRQAAREAVRRNQLKRWVREFWRLNKSKLSEPVQMIVRFKPNVSAKTSWRFLSDELNALFSKAGLFRHEK
jgi:ribonuclease P protein component